MSTTDRELLVADAVLDLIRRSSDADPLELLHDLTAHACALLPVRCAGITVLDHLDGSDHVTYVTASDELCRRLVELQFDLDQGPCLDSARSRQPLPLTVLSGPGQARWPRFAPQAADLGITAVAAVSLRLPHLLLGALNLFMAHPPCTGARDLRLAQTLADATATALTHRHELAGKGKVIAQLQGALDSRVVIEQAKGVLAARLNITMDEAFARLRAHARSRRQKISVLAALVAQGKGPAELDPAR